MSLHDARVVSGLHGGRDTPIQIGPGIGTAGSGLDTVCNFVEKTPSERGKGADGFDRDSAELDPISERREFGLLADLGGRRKRRLHQIEPRQK